ncbi:hypothetical protein ACS0TY_006419 [Phlomoides rotata]
MPPTVPSLCATYFSIAAIFRFSDIYVHLFATYLLKQRRQFVNLQIARKSMTFQFEIEVNNGGVTEVPEAMPSVILGWFSEISPMWPGEAHSRAR